MNDSTKINLPVMEETSALSFCCAKSRRFEFRFSPIGLTLHNGIDNSQLGRKVNGMEYSLMAEPFGLLDSSDDFGSMLDT